MTYTIEHSNGRVDNGYESMDDALAHACDYYRDSLGYHADYEHADGGDGGPYIVLRDPESTSCFDFLCRVIGSRS